MLIILTLSPTRMPSIGLSLLLVNESSIDTSRGENIEIVLVNEYTMESPPPVTRFSSSIFDWALCAVPIS